MQARHDIYTVFPIRYLLLLIILVEGFASIAVEILAIRQLLPFVGGSVVVTSLIIGIFLLFLAIGYERGGRVDLNLDDGLRFNFIITAIATGIGLSYLFINFFFKYSQVIFGDHLVYPLMAYLLLVIAPIIYLLGQTLPITMNIVRQTHTAGVIAGKTLALSTIGSFLGSIVSTVVLMHYLGVAATVFIVFSCLMFLALCLSHSFIQLWRHFIFAVLSASFIFYLNVIFEQNKFKKTTAYANYEIYYVKNNNADTGQRILFTNETPSSSIDDGGTAFEYIEIIKKLIIDDLQLKKADILVLGAGGFTLSQSKDENFGNKYTYVDIEDQLKKIVIPDFIKKMDDTFIADDARHFVNVTKNQYDVIVFDVYSNKYSIPSNLLTYEFFKRVRDRLKESGVAIMNIIANPFFNDPYSSRIDNTIRAVFGSCAVIPISYYNNSSNIIYACNKKPGQDRKIYTDDKNTVTADGFNN